MEKIRKASRKAAANKIKSLTSADPHQKVDSSTWTPPEALNAGVKTGMRPISPRAYKRGGKVVGEVEGKKTKARADRKVRKSGGKTEMPDTDRKINRDLKKANEYREGTKHIGGMKKGGRIHKDGGGSTDDQIAQMIRQDQIEQGMRGRGLPERVPMPTPRPRDLTRGVRGDIPAPGLPGYKKGGRTKKDIGGGTPYDATIPGMPQGRAGKGLLRTDVAGPFKRGGKVTNKQMGGAMGTMAPRAVTPAQALMLRKRAMSGMPMANAVTGLAPQAGLLRKSGGKVSHMEWEHSKKDLAEDRKLAKKHGMSLEKWEKSKLDKKHDKQQSMEGLKNGGKAGEKWIQKAIKKPGALHKQLGVPAGEKIPAKKLSSAAEKGGKLGKRARLAQTLRSMHKDGGSVFEGNSKEKVPGVVGGRQARKAGGRTKGKTNINIVLSPNAAGASPAMPPMIPGAAGTPPMPPRPQVPPMGMPPMGMPPMGGMPAGMAPMAGAPPMGMPPMAGAMPPMARKAGGRVYRSYEDMDAGAGSGEGRLEKTEIQTHKK